MPPHRVISMTAQHAGETTRLAQASPRTGHRRQQHETWFDYASQTGIAARQRARLVAKGLTERLKSSAARTQRKGRQKVKQLGLHAALAASHRLVEIASRIERRLIRLNEHNEGQ